MRTPIPAVLVACLTCVAAAGCGTSQKVIRMDPLEMRARKGGQGPTVDVIEPSWLFTHATQDYNQGRTKEALRRFSLVIDRFPDSAYARVAYYNRGLCLLKLGRPADAAKDFREYLKRSPERRDMLDGLMKLGEALTEAGEWKQARDVLLQRLSLSPLDTLDELEVRARLVKVYRMMGKISRARRQARKVLRIYAKNLTRPQMRGNVFVAMASFEAAACLHDLFRKIKFILPVERMEKDLLDKATLFLKAQSEYLRTIRIRNTYYAVKAGIQLGRLYEDFYQDIMDAEVPQDLTEEERRIYFTELRRQARPLLKKAIDAYEKNMTLALMHGAKPQWFQDTKERLKRLRSLLAGEGNERSSQGRGPSGP